MSFTFSVSPGLLPSAMLQILYARVLSSLLTCSGQYARQHQCIISIDSEQRAYYLYSMKRRLQAGSVMALAVSN
eukprot:15160-Heterococcus_DN1.PRE.3